MPVNKSEEYLASVARKSFLSFWAYSNPYWAPVPTSDLTKREELCDLIVIFGNSLIVFSDKSSAYPDGKSELLNWQRWYRRSIGSSAGQLVKAAARLKQPDCALYEAHKSPDQFPLPLPSPADVRVFLVAVARTAGETCQKKFGRRSLRIDSRITGDEEFLTVGTTIKGNFIHVVDALTFDAILSRLDTVRDLISYLTAKENAFGKGTYVIEGEENLLATYVGTSLAADSYEIPANQNATEPTRISDGLWTKYVASARYKRTLERNKVSYNIDRLIEQFAEDVRTGSMLEGRHLPYSSHERAFRYLAAEKRFSRRIIAESMRSILLESDTKTFWMETVTSPEFPEIRYAWVSYPPPPKGMQLEEVEQAVLAEMSRYIVAVHHHFKPGRVIGIGVPNRANTMTTYFVRISDDRPSGVEPTQEHKRMIEEAVVETKLHLE